MAEVRVVPYRRTDSPRWYARWWDPVAKKRVKKPLGIEDYREAKRLCAELERDMSEDLDSLGREGVSLVREKKSFVRTLRKTHSRKTADSYEYHLDAFLAWVKRELRTDNMLDITPEHVAKFLKKDVIEKRGCAATTANRYRATLSSFWSATRSENRALNRRANPVQAARRHPEQTKVPDPLRSEEVKKLVHHLETTRSSLLLPIMVGLETGARRGEICGLRKEDIDFERGHVLIRRSMDSKTKQAKPVKDKAERSVPLTSRLKAALEEHMRPYGREVCIRRSVRWDPDNLSHEIRRLGRKLKIPRLNGPQVLRCTYASHLLGSGAPMAYVSQLLGHASVTTTERRYARFLAQDHHAVALERMYG